MANRFEKAETGVVYGLDMLYNHCAKLNALNWVKASGLPYFINQRRDEDGKIVHFLDRETKEKTEPPCTPEQARAILIEFGLTSLGGFKV
jgi:hypothetical protein